MVAVVPGEDLTALLAQVILSVPNQVHSDTQAVASCPVRLSSHSTLLLIEVVGLSGTNRASHSFVGQLKAAFYAFPGPL